MRLDRVSLLKPENRVALHDNLWIGGVCLSGISWRTSDMVTGSVFVSRPDMVTDTMFFPPV